MVSHLSRGTERDRNGISKMGLDCAYAAPTPISSIQALNLLEQEHPDYDMDDDDERWLVQHQEKLSARSGQDGALTLSHAKFEEMMDRLEKGSGHQALQVKHPLHFIHSFIPLNYSFVSFISFFSSLSSHFTSLISTVDLSVGEKVKNTAASASVNCKGNFILPWCFCPRQNLFTVILPVPTCTHLQIIFFSICSCR